MMKITITNSLQKSYHNIIKLYILTTIYTYWTGLFPKKIFPDESTPFYMYAYMYIFGFHIFVFNKRCTLYTSETLQYIVLLQSRQI